MNQYEKKALNNLNALAAKVFELQNHSRCDKCDCWTDRCICKEEA